PEVSEILLLCDELPAGQSYPEAEPGGRSGAALRFLPCWRFGAIDNALRIVRAVRAEQPDVVLFNIQFASFGAGKVAAALGLTAPALVKAAGFPTIVLLHNIMETVDLKSAGFGGNVLIERAIRLFGTLTTRLLLRADLLALTIPKYVEILEQKYRTTNVLLAPHGAFEQAPPPVFAQPNGPLQIMTFGKFGTYKRIEVLIDAYRRLIAETRPPLELVIAGTDSPNAPGYLEGLRLQHADLPGLRFTGYVAEEDVPRIFGEAAVVVFPYTSTTGSSGVLHQAGNYGKAVALPRLGDLAELIAEEGYTGEFFEPDNPHSLAEALANVLDNPARREEIGTRNYLAACGLPMAEVVDWYLLHAQTLLRQRKPAAPRRPVSSRQ
ncbi:MAG TPA: glycosyltransferase, partial [Roseiflexaceae bacterium]|nr:glycosyltransferase [Roseiflexaceae bacterium]